MNHEPDTVFNTAPESTEKPVNENMAEGNEYRLIEKHAAENAEGTAAEKHMEENGHILYESPAAENTALVENAAADMSTGKEIGYPSRKATRMGATLRI